jgi:hypothetical protein
MDRGLYFAGFGLEFAPASKPKEAVSGGSKKKMFTPNRGMRADPFVATNWARLGRKASRTLL